MAKLTNNNREAVVEEYKLEFRRKSHGQADGNLQATPQRSIIRVHGSACVKAPLEFMKMGCSNACGAKGFGKGVIQAGNQMIRDGGAPILRHEDSGKCQGILLGDPSSQQPGPCECEVKISFSGQGGEDSPQPSPAEPAVAAPASVGAGLVSFVIAHSYPDGTPVSKAPIQLVREDGWKQTARLDQNGKCACRVPPGPLTILFEDEPVEFQVAGQTHQNLAFKLTFSAADATTLVDEVLSLQHGVWDVLVDDVEIAAVWVWGVVEGDFASDPGTGQIIVGTLIGMVPLLGYVTDARDLVAMCLKLRDEKERAKPVNWLLFTLLFVGLIPVFGAAVRGTFRLLVKEETLALKELLAVMRGMGNGGNALRFLEKIQWAELKRGSVKQMKEFFDRINLISKELIRAIDRYRLGATALQARLRKFVVELEEIRRAAEVQVPKAVDWFREKIQSIVREGKKSEYRYAEAAQAEEKSVAKTTAHTRKVVETAVKKNKRPHNGTFKRRMLQKIWDDPSHPLNFLVDRTGLKPRWKGRAHYKRGLEHELDFEVGHKVSRYADISEERLMMQSPESNALAGLTENERAGAIFINEAVDIGGVPVERGTVLQWEKLAKDPENRHIFGDFLDRLKKPAKDLPTSPGWRPGE